MRATPKKDSSCRHRLTCCARGEGSGPTRRALRPQRRRGATGPPRPQYPALVHASRQIRRESKAIHASRPVTSRSLRGGIDGVNVEHRFCPPRCAETRRCRCRAPTPPGRRRDGLPRRSQVGQGRPLTFARAGHSVPPRSRPSEGDLRLRRASERATSRALGVGRRRDEERAIPYRRCK